MYNQKYCSNRWDLQTFCILYHLNRSSTSRCCGMPQGLRCFLRVTQGYPAHACLKRHPPSPTILNYHTGPPTRAALTARASLPGPRLKRRACWMPAPWRTRDSTVAARACGSGCRGHACVCRSMSCSGCQETLMDSSEG